MSHECCSFCEQLPGIAKPGWAGRASKCPVCKQDVWAAQDGTSYRVDATLVTTRRTIRPQWAAIGIIAVGCVSVACYLWLNNGESGSPSQPRRVLEPIAVCGLTTPIDGDSKPTAIALPDVRAKPVRSESPARAKSSAPELQLVDASRASVKAIPIVSDDVGPRLKAANRSVPVAWRWSYVNGASELEAMLAQVPEVDLDSEYLKKSKKQIDAFARAIAAENKNQPDAFIRKLMTDRSDLAGMPFLLGKDCGITAELSRELAQNSLLIREALSSSVQRTSLSQTKSARNAGIDAGPDAYRFWHEFAYNLAKDSSQSVKKLPALRQIVLAENRTFREKFVDHIGSLPGAAVSEALANRAVFDLDGDVRYRAISALRARPKAEYRDVLLNALRHPWAPVVQNACQALAALEVKEALPRLVDLLDEPAPNVPKVVPTPNGERKTVVKEMVRVNHHRNCLLCHAPVNDLTARQIGSRSSATVPLGPCPSGQEPLPPSSTTVYYSARPGVTLVRADVTYLRQDFSTQMKVADPSEWPVMQRYDFLVRTRDVNANDIDGRKIAAAQGEYSEAILVTLRTLTGHDAPPNAAAWRKTLELPPETK